MAEIIPLEKFGRDHWLLVTYVEAVSVEMNGFQVGFDPCMRQFEHSIIGLRLTLRCPWPARVRRASAMMVPDKDAETKYGTRLPDGTRVAGHDDWDCLHDLMEAGFFTTKDLEKIDGGEVLHLSLFGVEVANQIRYHKSNGGSTANFVPKFLEKPLGNVA